MTPVRSRPVVYSSVNTGVHVISWYQDSVEGVATSYVYIHTSQFCELNIPRWVDHYTYMNECGQPEGHALNKARCASLYRPYVRLRYIYVLTIFSAYFQYVYVCQWVPVHVYIAWMYWHRLYLVVLGAVAMYPKYLYSWPWTWPTCVSESSSM